MQSSDVRDYAMWKAKTAQLISNQADQAAIQTGIYEILSSWKENLCEIVTDLKAEAWTELQDIILKAVKLDEEINKSRALISVLPWSEETIATFEWDGVSVESPVGFEAGRPGMHVELVLAPALVKTGTADGKAYDTRSFLSKWVVLCTETREKFCSIGKRV
jgi:hypothetical protein